MNYSDGAAVESAQVDSVTIVTYQLDSGTVTNRTRMNSTRTSGAIQHEAGSLPASVSNYSAVAGERADGRQRIEATRSYPWSAIVHLEADLGDEFGQCSGTMIDDTHVLTAAHCVYDHDNGGWVDGLAASPGTNLQAVYDAPFDNQRGATFPFGTAEATQVQTYDRWISGQNRGFDIAVVTLNRSVGEYTGTFGYAGYPESNEQYTEPAHATGYPTNPPEEPGLTMWDDYDDGQGTTSVAFLPDLGCLATDRCHSIDMTLSGGQSGGPVWQSRTASENHETPFILSVNAAGYEAFGVPISQVPATGVRITDGKFSDIQNMVAAGTDRHSPTDQPDLRDAGKVYRGQSRSQVTANGSVFAAQIGVLNRGTAPAGPFEVRYRAVSTTSDTAVPLGAAQVDGLAPFRTVKTPAWAGTMPQTEAGTYRIEAEIDPTDSVPEFRESGTVTVGTITVTAGGENNTLVSADGEFTTDDSYDDYGLTAGYHDTYTITASEGDVLNAHVRPEKSHENPTKLVLYEPDGDLARESNAGPEGDAVLSDYHVQENGTYTLYVTSADRDDTFDYQLDVYHGLPADYVAGYGATVQGQIDVSDYYHRSGYTRIDGYYDVVAFNGTAGDTVSAAARVTARHENFAELALYQPDGDLVGTYNSGQEGEAVLSRHTLEETGRYRLAIYNEDPRYGSRLTNEFSYNLTLYEGLPAERELAYGADIDGRVNDSDRYLLYDFDGHHDIYAFEGRAGDRVSAELRPEKRHENTGTLLLFQPDGDRVRYRQGSGAAGDAVISRHVLEENGTYRLIVASQDSDLFGYNLSLYEGLPADGTLSAGETVRSAIGSDDRYLTGHFGGYHETYAFDANGGERVSIELRPAESIDDGELRLYGPDGTFLTAENGGAGDNAVISRYTLPDTDGTYRVVATSTDNTEQFAFDLSLYDDLPADDTLAYGESVSGAVTTSDNYLTGSPSGYHDVYAFNGQAGDRVSVELRANDDYTGHGELLLFGPSGTQVAADYGSGDGNDALISLRELPANGTYKIVATGDGYTDTLDYDIRLFEGVSVDRRLPEGVTLRRTLDRTDRFLQPGIYDGYHEVFSFNGTAGEVTTIEARPVNASDRAADMTLLQPDGDVAERDFSGGDQGNSVIGRHRLEESGQYRLVVTENDYDGVMRYDLSRYTGLPADESILYGESVSGRVTTADEYLPGTNFGGYHDVIAFNGSVGDTVSMNVTTPASTDAAPRLTLFEPDGDVHWTDTGYDSVRLAETTLDESGTYRAIVSKVGGGTMEYTYALNGPDNNPPRAVADATPSTVAIGNAVSLDGTASNDPDGDSLQYRWEQTYGPSVTLRKANTSRATFVAPNVSNGTQLGFDLRVTDSTGSTDIADVTVTVLNGTDRPVIRASSARVGAGYTKTINVTLTQAPTGMAGFAVEARVADANTARIVGGSVPDRFGGANVSVGPDNETILLSGADFDEFVEPGATDIRLGRIFVEGSTGGQTAITPRVVRLDDDRGDAVSAGVSAGTVRVPEPVVPPNSPRDLDDDRQFEDINGNDRLDFDDPVALFRRIVAEDPTVTETVTAYDFNRNGRIDADDAVELFREVAGTADGTTLAVGSADTSPARTGVNTDTIGAIDSTAEPPVVTVGNATVAPNNTTQVPIRLSTAPDGIAGFDIRIQTSDRTVANITAAGTPPTFSPNVTTVADNGTRARIVAADFQANVEGAATGQSRDSDITLATLTLHGATEGTTELAVAVSQLDDDDGELVTPATRHGRLAVNATDAAPAPVLRATLDSPVNYVGAPLRLRANASGTGLERIEARMGHSGVSTKTPVSCTGGSPCRQAVRISPETTSWNGTAYERVPVEITVVTDANTSTTTTTLTEIRTAGDASGDGTVDIADAALVGQRWNTSATNPTYSETVDLNNDGTVDIFDAVVLGQNWQDRAQPVDTTTKSDSSHG